MWTPRKSNMPLLGDTANGSPAKTSPSSSSNGSPGNSESEVVTSPGFNTSPTQKHILRALMPRALFTTNDLAFKGNTLKAKSKNKANGKALSDVGSLMCLVSSGQLKPRVADCKKHLSKRQLTHGWWWRYLTLPTFKLRCYTERSYQKSTFCIILSHIQISLLSTWWGGRVSIKVSYFGFVGSTSICVDFGDAFVVSSLQWLPACTDCASLVGKTACDEINIRRLWWKNGLCIGTDVYML